MVTKAKQAASQGEKWNRRVWRLIKRYARARIEHSWMGGKDPEEWEEVLNELCESKAKLMKCLDEAVNEISELRAGLESRIERVDELKNRLEELNPNPDPWQACST